MTTSAKRETVIVPLGYMTTPNQHGVFPEGALSVAQNVTFRNKGKLLTAPSIGTQVTVGGASTQRAWSLMPLDAGHVYAFVNDTIGNVWQVVEAGNVANLPSGVTGTALFSYGRTSPVRSRERMLVNSSSGVLVGDSMAPATPGDRALRYAGLPQPSMSIGASTAGIGFPIPAGIMVGYAAVWTREYADGYIVKSVPTPGIKWFNNDTSDRKPTINVNFQGSSDLLVGDYFELYRTDGLSTTTVNSDPGTTYKLIIRRALTASDLTAGFLNMADETIMLAPFYSTTGRELYTNPYQEGSTGANRQPEVNGAQAVFKGYTFFGNITERPQLTFSVPAGIWNINGTVNGAGGSANARANGIGGFSGTGTVTVGNPTVTGISTADMVGIRVGQVSVQGFPFDARIVSVGSTSFTCSKNAISGGSFFAVWDVVEISMINNVAGYATVSNAYGLVTSMLGANESIEVTTSRAVAPATPTFSTSDPAQNDVGLVITIEPSRPSVTSFTVRASGGDKYSPPLPLTTQTAQTFTQTTTPNLLRWSKDSEPEHAPSVNETRVGSGKIIQLVGTKDALWIFCTDGIFRLSGDAGVWQVNVIAPGCVLCSPGCATSMRDQVYAYTNYGFVAVTDSGVVPISDLQIKAQLPGPPYVEGSSSNGFLVNNDDDEEVLVFTGFPASTFYIYNARQAAFTYVSSTATGLTSMTAAAFQQNPASGTSTVLIANVSTSAKYGPWNAATFLAPSVQYRNLYAKNPMSLKQWIDCTLSFEPVSALTLTATVNGFFAGNPVIAQSYNDSYASFGVPRQFAIASSIQPGWSCSSLGIQLAFEGVSCRLVEAGTQQVRR